jgi:hypothetical protein
VAAILTMLVVLVVLLIEGVTSTHKQAQKSQKRHFADL